MKVTLPPRDAMNDECRRVLAHAGLVLLCWQWMSDAVPENSLQGHGVDGGPTAVLGGLLPRGLRRVRAAQQLGRGRL